MSEFLLGICLRTCRGQQPRRIQTTLRRNREGFSNGSRQAFVKGFAPGAENRLSCLDDARLVDPDLSRKARGVILQQKQSTDPPALWTSSGHDRLQLKPRTLVPARRISIDPLARSAARVRDFAIGALRNDRSRRFPPAGSHRLTQCGMAPTRYSDVDR